MSSLNPDLKKEKPDKNPDLEPEIPEILLVEVRHVVGVVSVPGADAPPG